MFFYEGQSCPVCGQFFCETDDVVACPQCGAPHHRECWKKEGHCHFAADHGTDRQWARTDPAEKTAKPGEAASSVHDNEVTMRQCPNCGRENFEFAEFCSYCGRELDNEDWSSVATNQVPPPSQQPPQPQVNQFTPPPRGDFTPFGAPYVRQDPFGGIPRTESIEGVSVETVAEVLGPNSHYYLPRFYHMSRSGKRVSWNWSAFLLSYHWLLYRKNLLWGILIFIFEMVLILFYNAALLPLQTALSTGNPVDLPENAPLLLLIITIASLVMLAVNILFGLFGNYLYMQNVLRKARKLQDNPDSQYDQSFLNTGGTSFFAAILPNLVLMFLQYVMVLLTL